MVVIPLHRSAKVLQGDIFGLGTGHDLPMVAAVEQLVRAMAEQERLAQFPEEHFDVYWVSYPWHYANNPSAIFNQWPGWNIFIPKIPDKFRDKDVNFSIRVVFVLIPAEYLLLIAIRHIWPAHPLPAQQGGSTANPPSGPGSSNTPGIAPPSSSRQRTQSAGCLWYSSTPAIQ